MFTLPQLLQEDVERLDAALGELITKSEATAALLADKAGFLIAQQGNTDTFDATTVAALGSGSFAATREIAALLGEEKFASAYQQGETTSLYLANVDEHCVLLVIFPAATGVGVVKFYANKTVTVVADTLKEAAARCPANGIDLSVMNLADTGPVFRKKAS
jgi:predicted regulator of Ras-like GTPase activity (Roadblock/LC7/MglB family)